MLEGVQRDRLTGCFTKDALIPFMHRVIRDSGLSRKGFSIALIDLDGFKKINSKFGHLFGDEALKYVSSTMRLTLEDKAYIFRSGGEEFVAVFLDKTKKEAYQLTRQCNYNVARRPFLYAGTLYKITISGGLSRYPDDGGTPKDLLDEADRAMYFSKRFGGNLITEAGRVGYLKLRNILAVVAVIFAIVNLVFFLNRYVYKQFIQHLIYRIKNIRVTSEPGDMATFILKNGDVFSGRILDQSGNTVRVIFEIGGGQVTLVLDKEEIKEIRYKTE